MTGDPHFLFFGIALESLEQASKMFLRKSNFQCNGMTRSGTRCKTIKKATSQDEAFCKRHILEPVEGVQTFDHHYSLFDHESSSPSSSPTLAFDHDHRSPSPLSSPTSALDHRSPSLLSSPVLAPLSASKVQPPPPYQPATPMYRNSGNSILEDRLIELSRICNATPDLILHLQRQYMNMRDGAASLIGTIMVDQDDDVGSSVSNHSNGIQKQSATPKGPSYLVRIFKFVCTVIMAILFVKIAVNAKLTIMSSFADAIADTIADTIAKSGATSAELIVRVTQILGDPESAFARERDPNSSIVSLPFI